MRFLLVLLFLATASFGQSLRWTYILPDPAPFGSVELTGHVHTDATGNTALVLVYSGNGQPQSFRLLWLDRRGRQLMLDDLGSDGAHVVGVTALSCLVKVGPSTLRNYVRTAHGVNVSTVFLGPDDEVQGTFASDDPHGFFVLTVEGSKVTALKRYGPR